MKLGMAVGIGIFGVGLGGGLYAASPEVEAAARAATPDTMALCAGGTATAFAATLEPSEVRMVNGKAQLRLDLALTSHMREGTPRYRYAVEVVDDRGRKVVEPTRSRTRQLAPGGEHLTVDAPEGLDDGFYQLRVTVAAIAGSEEASTLAVTYLEVANGDLGVIEANDYLARSKANVGVKL